MPPADGAGDLQRSDVVAWQDEPVGLEEIVGPPLDQRVVRRQFAGPAVGAQRAHDVGQLAVVAEHHAAFHRRDVMREEKAEGVEATERPGLPATELGIHRFAIVLDEVEAMTVGEIPDHVQRARIAEDADPDDQARARRQRLGQLRDVHVERLQFDIDEAQLQPVLLQRVIGGAPGNGRDDHLVAALQRPVLLEEQRGHGNQVCRGARVGHHRVLAAEIAGELVLESLYLLAHGQAARGEHAMNRLDLLIVPGGSGKRIEHRRLFVRTGRGTRDRLSPRPSLGRVARGAHRVG